MATNNCRNTVKVLDCGNDLENQRKNVYEPFSVCLPFGRQLVWDGQGLRLKGSVTIADGQYGLFTVENGCITKADEQPACEYTAQPCTPAATPCGEGSSNIVLQPGEDNLLNFDATGRLGAQLNYSTTTEGMSISGYGTVNSPLVINYTPGEAARTYVQSGSSAIGVRGTGTATEPYVITHASSVLGAGTYGQFTIDDFGHVTGYEDPGLGVTQIIGTNGITATNAGTVYTLSLERQTSYGTYQTGAYEITINGEGLVTEVTRNITIDVGEQATSITLDPLQNTFTFNAYGSLVDFTPVTPVACDQFAGVFDAGRDTTSITFTTTKSAYFKITYRGCLPASKPSGTIYGYYTLASPYSLYVGTRRQSALAFYSTENTGIVEVVAITDAFYGAGTYTVDLRCSTEDFTFIDGAVLTVELIGRGNA